MHVIIIFLGFVFTVFSGSILAYLSIATMLGPWMAPTIALLTNILLKHTPKSFNKISGQRATTAVQAIGSVGGAIATGIGFGLPTIYFLNRQEFDNLIASPFFFYTFIATLCLSAGALGIILGKWFSDNFIDKKNLPFPISQLTYSVISSKNNHSSGLKIFNGMFFATVFAILRDGFGKFNGFIPKSFYIFTPHIEISMWPTIWAIGYTAGMNTAYPLLLGLFTKYFIIFPINNYIIFFKQFSIMTFTVAFCGGMVLSEVIFGVFKFLLNFIQNSNNFFKIKNIKELFKVFLFKKNRNLILLTIITLISAILFLSYFKFSVLSQILFLTSCIFATYQINIIGGTIGLIQYGRFSTYILIPMYMCFDLTALQLTIVCIFFNVCAATASDLLFDTKTGDLARISRKKMWALQWVGLTISAITMGIIFYLLFTNLQLGSKEFFAQRSQAKALLLQSLNFDLLIVSVGFIYGIIVKKLGFSPTMVFGGIIMPNSLSLGLILGALLNIHFKRERNDYQAFCAGVFASESIWIVANILLKLL